MPTNVVIQWDDISISELAGIGVSSVVTASLVTPAGVLQADLTSVTEQVAPNVGTYTGDAVDVPAGDYKLVTYLDGNVSSKQWVKVGDGDGTYVTGEKIELDLENQPSGATLADQTTIISKLNGKIDLAIYAAIRDSLVESFPRELIQGDEYSNENGNSIRFAVRDSSGAAITASGDNDFADVNSVRVSLTLDGEEIPEVTLTGEWDATSSEFVIEWAKGDLDSVTNTLNRTYTYHNWGLKVTWPTNARPITLASGQTRVLPRFVPDL